MTSEKTSSTTPHTTSHIDKYTIEPDCSEEEFIAVSKVYAREIVKAYELSVNVSQLDWEVSRRAKRRAGQVKYTGTEATSVVLTWAYFAELGWEAMASTIRHELIHIHLLNERGDSGHGDAFQKLAKQLDTTVNCELFVEPNWWITCVDCGLRLPRYRESKLVSSPEKYQCGKCSGDLVVE
ncbi:SprT-like domain-containing protein [Halorubrum sp. HHNYT27]|uniref:SprT-like domain-containing protein n=1 Tax=Halorubrum sp. HHNYT27 TaxID=3402275 RepID=UPI003EBE80C1